jgi:hypothetical protein
VAEHVPSGQAMSHAADAAAPAHTPGNNRAVIYAPMDFHAGFTDDYQPVAEALSGEGYKVTIYRGVLLRPHGTIAKDNATLANFERLSGAGVVVISTHSQQA